MAQREMSGKALLDKLYSGLDTMPTVETEMNARDLRRLNDEFLGKPAEPNASVQHAATAPRAASKARPASRSSMLRTSLVVVVSVATVGMIGAGALRASDKRAALPAPPPVALPVADPEPVMQAVEVAPPPQPVVLVNPFDASERFTFPPGTSKAEAREQMATLLLQRAAERGAHLPRSRKLAADRRASKTGHGS